MSDAVWTAIIGVLGAVLLRLVDGWLDRMNDRRDDRRGRHSPHDDD